MLRTWRPLIELLILFLIHKLLGGLMASDMGTDPILVAAREIIGLGELSALPCPDPVNVPMARNWLQAIGDPNRVGPALTVHHLVCDGWGAGLITRHLAHAYHQGDLSGVPRSEPYSACSGQEALNRYRPAYQQHLRWWKGWKDALTGRTPEPRLGTVEGPTTTMDTIEWHHPMPPSFRDALRELARPARTSTYVVALALVAAALQQCTGIRERVLLVSHVGPRFPDFEHTVGLFSNRLPLLVSVDQTRSVADLVHTVRSGMLDLIEHAAPTYADLLDTATDPRTVEAQLTVQYVPPQFVASDHEQIRQPVTFRFLRYRVAASALHLHLLLMEEPEGSMWWSTEFRTDVLRPGEAVELLHGTMSGILALATRPADPIAGVLGRS